MIGTKHEPRAVLTRQDWRHVTGRPWGRDSNGFWLLEAPEPAAYKVEVIFKEEYPAGQAIITAGKARQQLDLAAKKKRGHTTMMMMPAGKFKLSVDAVSTVKSKAHIKIKHGEKAHNALGVLGLTPEETGVTGLDRALVAGRWFEAGEDKVCILPTDMVGHLGIDLADVGEVRVRVFGDLFKVVCVLDS